MQNEQFAGVYQALRAGFTSLNIVVASDDDRQQATQDAVKPSKRKRPSVHLYRSQSFASAVSVATSTMRLSAFGGVVVGEIVTMNPSEAREWPDIEPLQQHYESEEYPLDTCPWRITNYDLNSTI